MERYDIAIIGTGPAGLEAAITGTIRNKKVLLVGSKDLSMKLTKAHEIQNYLGFPAVKGEDLAKAFQKHLDQLGIGITEERISAVYAMGDYYAIQAGEQMLEATTVILATGVVQGKPLPGETENLGEAIKSFSLSLLDFFVRFSISESSLRTIIISLSNSICSFSEETPYGFP